MHQISQWKANHKGTKDHRTATKKFVDFGARVLIFRLFNWVKLLSRDRQKWKLRIPFSCLGEWTSNVIWEMSSFLHGEV